MIFLLGLSKKLVLADMFGGFADTGFHAAAEGLPVSFFEAWYAALAYALQIYFDFSGYSDMAVGLARMFGIHFPANFDSPYKAGSITEFWRRWHVTLGRFLRDYIYIPLGGGRCGILRRNCNLMATMLLGGLWHGAGWNFVLWGGLHGMCLIAHAHWKRFARPLPKVLANPLTLLMVVVAWIPFRADSFAATLNMLRGLTGLNGVALPRMIVQAIPVLGKLVDPVPLLPYLGSARTLSFPEVSGCLLLGWVIVLALPHVHQLTERGRSWALIAGFAFSIQALFFAPDVAPFLYFRF
jgi:D-alanyl-lipoteichoic acid acyltransferase DltB (MBOAT superfamily)